MQKALKDLNPFYIQILDRIAGPVKNASRLLSEPYLVETKLNDDIKKVLKQKLQGLRPMLIEKH
jgi:hypothetical protein